MERVNKSFVKLSPNEVEKILFNEKKKWRLFRLQQVRAQAKEEALRLREAVQIEEEKQKSVFKRKIENDWMIENQKNLNLLEEEYSKSLEEFGEAHRRAESEKNAAEAFKLRRLEEDKVAIKRGKEALHLLDKKKIESEEREMEVKIRKQMGSEKERKRALKIAKMPTPPKFKPQKTVSLPVKPKKVMFHEAGTLTTSSYVPSTVKIVKEETKDMVSATEVAKQDNEKLKQRETSQKLKEREIEKKIRERGRIARKRERTREVYSQLMKELKEAEENHQLSDYLQADESQEDLQTDFREMSESREGEAVEKVREILNKELETTKIVHIKMGAKPLSPRFTSISTAQSIKEGKLNTGIGHETSPDDISLEDKDGEVDSQLTAAEPLSDPDEIHLKETVPIHKLPIFKEKFVVRKIDDHPSQTSSTFPESSRSESSFEEIRVKIDVNNIASEASSSVSKEYMSPAYDEEGISSSRDREYLKYPQILKKKLKQFQHSNVKTRSRMSSETTPVESSNFTTSSTEYMKIPKSPPVADTGKETVWKNIKHIQESRTKIQKLINELKPNSDDTETKISEKGFQTFRTPLRIYTKAIKTDGSGERPLTKRQKFEEQKKILLEYYMQRLLRMKEDELKQITASTVESSGIDMGSETYLLELKKKMKITTSDSLVSSSTTTVSSILDAKFDDVDTIPIRMGSTTPVSSDVSQTLIPSTISTSKSLPPSSTFYKGTIEDEDPNQGLKQQICLRLLQLQRLKQELILKQQNALGQLDQDRETVQDNSIRSTSNKAVSSQIKQDKSRKSESSLEWSLPATYQTPSREDSTHSGSNFLSLTRDNLEMRSIDSHEDGNIRRAAAARDPSNALKRSEEVHESITPPIHDQNDGRKDQRRKEARNLPSIQETSNGSESPYEEELLVLRDSLRRLTVASRSKDSTPSSQSSHPSESKGEDEGGGESKPSSASVTSMPDMTQILQNFGLGWAMSMIKKMDIAEENHSSDSSKL